MSTILPTYGWICRTERCPKNRVMFGNNSSCILALTHSCPNTSMPWQDIAGQGRHGHAYDLNKDDEPAPAVEASLLVRVAFHYSF